MTCNEALVMEIIVEQCLRQKSSIIRTKCQVRPLWKLFSCPDNLRKGQVKRKLHAWLLLTQRYDRVSKGIDLTDIVEKASFVDINSGHECVNCVDPAYLHATQPTHFDSRGNKLPPKSKFLNLASNTRTTSKQNSIEFGVCCSALINDQLIQFQLGTFTHYD